MLVIPTQDTENKAPEVLGDAPKFDETPSLNTAGDPDVVTEDNPADYVPSNWDIAWKTGCDTLVCRNNVTQRRFEGTMDEFNAMLKGN